MKPSGAPGHTPSTSPRQPAQPSPPKRSRRNTTQSHVPVLALGPMLALVGTRRRPPRKGPGGKADSDSATRCPWRPSLSKTLLGPVFGPRSTLQERGEIVGTPRPSLPPHVAHVSSRRPSPHTLHVEAMMATRPGADARDPPFLAGIVSNPRPHWCCPSRPSVAVLKPRQDSGGCERPVGYIVLRQSSGEPAARSEDAVVTPFAPISTARRLTLSARAVPWIWRHLLSTWTVRRPTGCLLASCHFQTETCQRRRGHEGCYVSEATLCSLCKTVGPFSAVRATCIKGSPGGL